jgi:hypothetical protein
MKTNSLANPMPVLRGLRLLAFAAFTVGLLSTGTASASVFFGNPTALPESLAGTSNLLLGFRITVTTSGSLEAFGVHFRSGSGQANVGLYAADGGGGEPGTLVAQTGAFTIASGVLERLPTAPVTLTPGNYWIMADYSGAGPTLGGASTGASADVVKYRTLTFTGSLPVSFASGQTFTYTGQKLNYYIIVSSPTSVHSAIFIKGDAVPGIAGASFSSFGVPAISSASGAVAVLGTWTGPTGGGAGIFAEGLLVAAVGGVVSGNRGDQVVQRPGHR